jgi:small GTP-binding protein
VNRRNEFVFVGRSNVGKSTLFRQIFGVKVKIGKKPGVTLKPFHFKCKGFIFTDLPGYGYMHGLRGKDIRRIGVGVLEYIEKRSTSITAVIHVIDAPGFIDIAKRCTRKGEIPVDVELFHYFHVFDFPVILAINKMDKIRDPDQAIDYIIECMGLLPPWRQWPDVVAPISGKSGEVESLKKILKNLIISSRKHEALKCIR